MQGGEIDEHRVCAKHLNQIAGQNRRDNCPDSKDEDQRCAERGHLRGRDQIIGMNSTNGIKRHCGQTKDKHQNEQGADAENLVNCHEINPDRGNDCKAAEQAEKLARAEPFRQIADRKLNNRPANDKQAEEQANLRRT